MVKSIVLAEVTRGSIVESMHLGDVAVVDKTGKLLYYAGDPGKVTYMRSAAKPLQAIAYVERGGPERFGLGGQEIAVTCASHSGQDVHVEAVYSILKKIGLDESYLQCGTHSPFHRPTARRMAAEGRKSTAVHCNCSGKHSGMLTLSVMLGADAHKYLDAAGPVQRTILETASEMMGVAPDSVILGIDGCGVPVYGVPLTAMALGFARLSDPSGLSLRRARAVETISRAMRSHPQIVAGTGRFTTDLLAQAGDRILAKSGAEAVYCIALAGKGVGVAFKVLDGESRPIAPAAIEILRQLGALTHADIEALGTWARPPVKNLRGELCGEIRPAVRLVAATGDDQ